MTSRTPPNYEFHIDSIDDSLLSKIEGAECSVEIVRETAKGNQVGVMVVPALGDKKDSKAAWLWVSENITYDDAEKIKLTIKSFRCRLVDDVDKVLLNATLYGAVHKFR